MVKLITVKKAEEEISRLQEYIDLKLEEMQRLEKINKIKNKRNFYRNLAKYINLAGGVTVWDKLDEKEAYDKAWNFVVKSEEYV